MGLFAKTIGGIGSLVQSIRCWHQLGFIPKPKGYMDWGLDAKGNSVRPAKWISPPEPKNQDEVK